MTYPTTNRRRINSDAKLIAIWAQIKGSPGELYGDIHSARIVLKK
jgi:hypothetical protein